MSDDFDISTLAVEDTSTFQLRDASGAPVFTRPTDGSAPKPVTVTIYGPGSDEYAEAVASRASRNMQRARKGKGRDLSADEIRREGAMFLADITSGFGNLRYKASTATGRELHMAIYRDRRIGFIADFVNEKIGDWESFLGNSPTS